MHLTGAIAARVAVVLVLAAVLAARLSDRPAPWGRRWSLTKHATRETGIILGLFALWQFAGGLALTHVAGAFDRAHTIVRWERFLPLPSELTMQSWVLPHEWIVKASNTFYLYAHVNGIVIFLVWLFVRHRDRYPWARNVLAISTGLCLLTQLIPVAPPRMLVDVGFVDTAVFYNQSVYGPFGSGIANQLSAMPSVHVGWAVFIAYVVIRVSTSPWRWLILLHPFVTVFVVVVTANHFWADGLVAAVIFAAVFAAAQAVESARLRSVGSDRDLLPHAVAPR